MAVSAKKRRDDRIRRHNRVRKTLRGTAQRPRIAVFRSNKHISAQVIDDIAGVTLASVSTTESALRGDVNSNIEAATKAGALLAERAKAAGVEEVVFDRGGFRYHGRVAALADAARQGGLKFCGLSTDVTNATTRAMVAKASASPASSTSTESPRSSRAVVVSRSLRSW